VESKLICIGVITGVHGLRGEVKVKSFSDHPDRFSKLPGTKLLWRKEGETKSVNVEAVRAAGHSFVVALEGVVSPEQAQSFVMGELLVPEALVLPLPPGSYYVYQLIGIKVLDENGDLLGIVREVLHLGSNDVYAVQNEQGELLIPALKSIVHRVDLSNRTMHVTLPAGLVD